MRALALLLTTVALLGGCKEGGPQDSGPAKSGAVGVGGKSPVKGAKLVGERIDRDGDGRAETRRWVDASGVTMEERDLDGDGIADVVTRVETNPEPAPGIEVGPKPLETEIDPKAPPK